MYIAVDTSSEYLQLAVCDYARNIRLIHSDRCGLRHSEVLVPRLQSVLAAYDAVPVEGVICSAGPGSFNGLRIGLASMKGLAQGVGAPLVSVSVLNALACSFSNVRVIVLAALEARRSRYFLRFYDFTAENVIAARIHLHQQKKKTRQEGDALSDLDADMEAMALSEHCDWKLEQIIECIALQMQKRKGLCEILIVGPQSASLYSALVQGYAHYVERMQSTACTPVFRFVSHSSWIFSTLELGRLKLERGVYDRDDEGPMYLRGFL